MVDLMQFEQQLQNQSAAYPLDQWQPELSGDMDLVIKSNGDWIHQGGKIKRPNLVKLFARILRRENDGCYYLISPVEKWRIHVEDAALMMIDMDIVKQGEVDQQCIFTTNVGSVFSLGKQFPMTVKNDIPYVALPYGLSAKLARSVYYRLVENAEQRGESLGVYSGGMWFELGKV